MGTLCTRHAQPSHWHPISFQQCFSTVPHPRPQIGTFRNPSSVAGGILKRIHISTTSRQPSQVSWTIAHLNAKLTINLGMAIDRATHNSYPLELNSYLTFCCLHDLDIEPTQWTLALYVTFQSTHINPQSIDTYLSGITDQLKTHFPYGHTACKVLSYPVLCRVQRDAMVSLHHAN